MNSLKKYVNGFLALTLIVLATSCSKKTVGPDEAASRLAGAKEPAMLVSVQIKNILDKGGLSNYENIPILARPFIGDKMNMFVKKGATGLDFSKKSYFFMYPTQDVPEIILLAQVSDKEKADAYLAEAMESDIQENDGYNYILNDGMSAWNDKLFIMASGMQGDKEAKLKRISEIFEIAAESEAKPKKFFAEVLNDKRDLALCMAQDKAMELSGQKTDEKAKAIMRDCYTLVFASFENGRISCTTRAEFTQNAKSQMDFFSKDGLPEVYKGFMGIQKPWAAGGINMNFSRYYQTMVNFIPESAREQIYKQTGIDLVADSQLKELLGGLGSHIMISISAGEPRVTNVTPEEKNFAYKPTIIAAIDLSGVLLKGMLDSAMTKFKKDGYYEIGDPKEGSERLYIIFTNDNVAMATNSFAALNTIKTKGSLPVHDHPMSQPMFKYPIAGFFDFQQAATELNEYDKSISDLLGEFESIVCYGSVDGLTMELNFTDKSKNGLWTLFHTAKTASGEYMKRKLKM